MFRKSFFALLSFGALLALQGCIKEDVADCPGVSQGVVLKYRFDLNMDYADRLGDRVAYLQAYIFDANGVLFDTLKPPAKTEIANGYQRQVGLAPGTYTVLTWAGDEEVLKTFCIAHENDITNEESCGAIIGQTRLEDLRMFLKYTGGRTDDSVASPCACPFNDLFHGLVRSVTVKAGEYTEVPTALVKNTNVIRIIVSGLSALTPAGRAAEESDFDIRISGRNGHYKYDNLVGEYAARMEYTPFGFSVEGDAFKGEVKTMRLMRPRTDPFSNALLSLDVVYKPSNLVVCQGLDVVGAILQAKIPARDSEGHIITGSEGDPVMELPTLEYLDRQDHFDIEFKAEKASGGQLTFTVYVDGWKVTNIYPVS